MKIVHISHTPVAGQPLIIVNALNRHTPHQARLITFDIAFYGSRTFDYDIDWQLERETALEILESADIIHLHQYWDLVENEFGIDFTRYERGGTRLIRQFHSVPSLLNAGDQELADEIAGSDVPLLALSHHQERYYPHARVVPLMVPVMDKRYLPVESLPSSTEKSILFSPTTFVSAAESRWDSKGAPETLALLYGCAEIVPKVAVNFVHDMPHGLLLEQRRNSYLAVDDIVTGTYHTTSLESLSMGVPVLAYLDSRVAENVRHISGCLVPLPWVDFHLHEARGALIELLRDGELRAELGQYSRSWMEKYWNDKALIQFYVDAYVDLIDNPDIYGSRRFDPENKLGHWFSRKSTDLKWEGRSILRYWTQLQRDCSGRLIIYGDSAFSDWLVDLLARHGCRPPEAIAGNPEGFLDKDFLATLQLTRLDCILLADNRRSTLDSLHGLMEANDIPARLVGLESLFESDGFFSAYGETKRAPNRELPA